MAGSAKVRVRTAARRRASSTRWLQRQLNDRFVQQAQKEGYRSRAAYKLLEIDDRFGLLKPGRRVLDLGSAPGGWAQVAARRSCRVVGVDLEPVTPLAGVVLLQGDAFDAAVIAKALHALGGPADVLLSDLAAPATGRRMVDRLRAEASAEAAIELAGEVLAPGGQAVIKLLRGTEAVVDAAARRQFAKTRFFRPEATRKESSELYLLAFDRRPAAAGEVPSP